jgi:hypothetical protein
LRLVMLLAHEFAETADEKSQGHDAPQFRESAKLVTVDDGFVSALV